MCSLTPWILHRLNTAAGGESLQGNRAEAGGSFQASYYLTWIVAKTQCSPSLKRKLQASLLFFFFNIWTNKVHTGPGTVCPSHLLPSEAQVKGQTSGISFLFSSWAQHLCEIGRFLLPRNWESSPFCFAGFEREAMCKRSAQIRVLSLLWVSDPLHGLQVQDDIGLTWAPLSSCSSGRGRRAAAEAICAHHSNSMCFNVLRAMACLKLPALSYTASIWIGFLFYESLPKAVFDSRNVSEIHPSLSGLCLSPALPSRSGNSSGAGSDTNSKQTEALHQKSSFFL